MLVPLRGLLSGGEHHRHVGVVMNPTPTPRHTTCRHYDKCLTFAVSRDWPGWTCAECGDYQKATTAPDAARSLRLCAKCGQESYIVGRGLCMKCYRFESRHQTLNHWNLDSSRWLLRDVRHG